MAAASLRRFGGFLMRYLAGLNCLEPMAMTVYLAGTDSDDLDHTETPVAPDLSGLEPIALVKRRVGGAHNLVHLA